MRQNCVLRNKNLTQLLASFRGPKLPTRYEASCTEEQSQQHSIAQLVHLSLPISICTTHIFFCRGSSLNFATCCTWKLMLGIMQQELGRSWGMRPSNPLYWFTILWSSRYRTKGVCPPPNKAIAACMVRIYHIYTYCSKNSCVSVVMPEMWVSNWRLN